MGHINFGRVVLGGLVAGLVINISEALLNGVVLAEEMNAMMAAMNKPPINASMVGLFVLLGFGLGVVLIWLYAAIRPRLGPGVQTAICAGLIVWGLAYLYPNLTAFIANLFPRRMLVIQTVWGFVEVMIAASAGAWLYRET
jgi:hypothetical protein